MLFLRYLAQRLGLALVTLLIVSAIVFAMTALLPGDVATRILGRAPDPQQLAILRERLGLDQPLLMRYFSWLGGLVVGDFGNSLVSGQPVSEVIGRRLGNTALLAVVAFLIYIPITVVPAAVQALYVHRTADNILSILTLAILSIPDFLLATFLLIVFVVWIPIAPPRSTLDAATGYLETAHALLLPALTIALVMGTYAVRYLRDSLIEVLNTDYIRMARLNGLRERTVLLKHAFPNALVPAINITSLNLTYLFGGVVVVEQVFAFPGFSALLIGALLQLDIPLIQATVLIAAAIYIAGNLLADILAMLLNPKLREA
jgi:peptide/nickel transport system permease protein